MLVQIPTKFKEGQFVKAKDTIFGDNGWSVLQRGDKLRIIGLTSFVRDYHYHTGYIVVHYPDGKLTNTPIVVTDSDIELDE